MISSINFLGTYDKRCNDIITFSFIHNIQYCFNINLLSSFMSDDKIIEEALNEIWNSKVRHLRNNSNELYAMFGNLKAEVTIKGNTSDSYLKFAREYLMHEITECNLFIRATMFFIKDIVKKIIKSENSLNVKKHLYSSYDNYFDMSPNEEKCYSEPTPTHVERRFMSPEDLVYYYSTGESLIRRDYISNLF